MMRMIDWKMSEAMERESADGMGRGVISIDV
jgi:hypothetical protein